ncbi:predicted protein [Naegleria gruberi]|uniref:Predicted protein n=1 Tax=Naegleria gruberi TaxID=5762 RepID=D2VUL1_NAEGR|nr:uncharacterized protein NAEGRDRAFT_52379 [Naegleria gruberi]EFC39470.1 predicted protein [Naegleria gruberi]|eukprot:XP_002672214.1 predicted protein [Naegleria gruberi strain NEG-M]
MISESRGRAQFFIGILQWPVLVWAILNLATGILGMIVYGAFTASYGPVYIVNQFVGLWLCVLLTFFSAQTVYIELKPGDSSERRILRVITLVVNILYFGVILVGSFILFVLYSRAGTRPDAIVWTILIMIICLLNVIALICRWYSSVGAGKEFIPDESKCFQLIKEKSAGASGVSMCLYITAIVVNVLLRFIFLIFLGLLISGSSAASNIKNYPMKGKLISVPLNDGSGRSQNIHYLCEGPTEGNSFTFLFEGDFTHGYADYYDIQRYLTALGRRSCIYDKPGLGYSDYLYKDQKDESTFYYNFLTSIGEKTPYVMVGWGGGGHIIYKFALEHPELVKSLTFLDVFPPGIEFTSMKDLKNWSQEQFNTYKNQELRGRRTLFGIINGLAVPWGLMSIFVGSSSNTSNADEITFWMSTEKTWITQSSVLDTAYADTGSYLKQNLTSTISVNLVVTKHDDNWVIKNN